jgi:hypothetical protein
MRLSRARTVIVMILAHFYPDADTGKVLNELAAQFGGRNGVP